MEFHRPSGSLPTPGYFSTIAGQRLRRQIVVVIAAAAVATAVAVAEEAEAGATKHSPTKS